MGRKADFLTEIEHLDRARYRILYLVTSEEIRVQQALAELADRRARAFIVWSVTDGFKVFSGPDAGRTQDPVDALTRIIEYTGDAYFVLKDFDAFLDNAVVARRLRDAATELRGVKKTILITAARLVVPPSLEKVIHVVDFPLPDLAELGEILDHILEQAKGQLDLTLTNGEREAALKAALGLTWDEAESVFAKSLVAKKTIDPRMVTAEKQQIIRKSEVLEYTPATEGMADVGGLDIFKDWAAQAGSSFTEKARAFGVDPVKGTLLIGVPGTGKSLAAKAIANAWGWPLVRADLGRLFGGIVGDTERNVRRMTQLAESIAPVVLWFDEIEKGIGGLEGSAQTTGGVELRLFGHLLTWMQEYTAPVFIVATANDAEALRPEFLRRFRHVFFVDLPTAAERKAIFEIHLRKRGRNPKTFELGPLVQRTYGFSGAEIEKAVQEGLLIAFSKGEALSELHLEWAIGQIVPISKAMRDRIRALEEWVRNGRARPASTRTVHETAAKAREVEI